MLGTPVGVMLRSMSASEFQTWRALAELEHEVAEKIRREKIDPADAERLVWQLDERE